MSRQATFEIHIEGSRRGEKLSPDLLDINEWIDVYKHARNLLYPDGSQKDRNPIQVKTELGSVRVLLTTAAALVIQAQALLGAVQQRKELGFLPKKQAEAIRYFYKIAKDEQFDIQLGEEGKLDNGLRLNRTFEFIPEKPVWVEMETFVSGKVTNLGGKTKSNIHLETEEYGSLIISATEDELAREDKNRLYQQIQVQIRMRQNAQTGEYDRDSAEFVQFIDLNEESPDEYLDRLIQAASPDWEEINDTDAWLKEIRGYES